MAPGETKLFKLDELEQATGWVTAQEGSDND